MRRSLGGGGAPFLVMTEHPFDDFLEMLLHFFTPRWIGTCWRLLPLVGTPILRFVTIGDVDLVPTLEDFDHFLSLSTPLSAIFVPSVWPRYRKRLTNLLGFKRPVVEAQTWYGSGIGGSMSFNFLYDWFHSLECPVGYRDDFVDLEERWTSYQHQTFLMAFFGTMLFPSSPRAVSFTVLPLVSGLPHGTSFIPALLSETIRSLSLCRETNRGRLGCCVHMLQLWFCSHLSVIARDQPIGFVSRNRVQAIVVLDLPFSRHIEG